MYLTNEMVKSILINMRIVWTLLKESFAVMVINCFIWLENGIRYVIFNRNDVYIQCMSIIKNHIKDPVSTTYSQSNYDDKVLKNIPSVVDNLTEEQSLVDIETSFRIRYSNELRSKKQQIYDKERGFKELDDEKRSVLQQMMRTPGRRGEIIKEEEISKEFARRFFETSR